MTENRQLRYFVRFDEEDGYEDYAYTEMGEVSDEIYQLAELACQKSWLMIDHVDVADDTSDAGHGFEWDRRWQTGRHPELDKVVVRDGKVMGFLVDEHFILTLDDEGAEAKRVHRISKGSGHYNESHTYHLFTGLEAREKQIAYIHEQMIRDSDHNTHDIEHLTKVWSYAKIIGEKELLDRETQFILEVAAIIHDIACPLCRVKYGNTNGKNQEKESDALVRKFLRDKGVSAEQMDRIAWLVSHHHTYDDVEAVDHQILLEADYIVNAVESEYDQHNIQAFYYGTAKTISGRRLIRDVLIPKEEE